MPNSNPVSGKGARSKSAPLPETSASPELKPGSFVPGLKFQGIASQQSRLKPHQLPEPPGSSELEAAAFVPGLKPTSVTPQRDSESTRSKGGPRGESRR